MTRLRDLLPYICGGSLCPGCCDGGPACDCLEVSPSLVDSFVDLVTGPEAATPSDLPLLRRSRRRRAPWDLEGLGWASPQSDADWRGSMGCEADGCVPGARFVLGGASFRVAKRVGTGAHSVVWQCERVADCKPGRASPTSPVPAEGGGDLALKVGSLGDPSRELAALHLLGPSGGLFPQLHGAVDFACGVRSALALSLHGPSLHEVQLKRGLRPCRLDFVVAAAAQLTDMLRALSRVRLIHADIKPQNLLVRPPNAPVDAELDSTTGLTLVDLGSCLPHDAGACNEPGAGGAGSGGGMYVQSRWYRAPEVLMGKPFGLPIDVWSAGCVLCEIATGRPLLTGKSKLEQLQLSLAICGGGGGGAALTRRVDAARGWGGAALGTREGKAREALHSLLTGMLATAPEERWRPSEAAAQLAALDAALSRDVAREAESDRCS